MPKGFSSLKTDNNIRANFDYVNPDFAEQHYGKYLIVKNGNGDDEAKHNRFYLCFKSRMEFMQTYSKVGAIKSQSNKKAALTELFTLFPGKLAFIWGTLSLLLEQGCKRKYAIKITTGFGLMLEVFERHGIALKAISDFEGKYLKIIRADVEKGSYSNDRLMSLTSFVLLIVDRFSLNLEVPKFRIYAKKKRKNYEDLSLSVTWQLDIYAQKELDNLIERVKEYQTWMKELNEIGDLFSLANLAHSYYGNIELLGNQKSSTANRPIRKLAKALHGVELQCWVGRKNGKEIYTSDNDIARAKELRKIAESGINITITDERMFAMWHKTVAPNYPYENEFIPYYKRVFGTSLIYWRNNIARKCKFSLSAFISRIAAGPGDIYPLYLLALCRSGLNQDPIKSWRIWKDKDGQYRVGVDSGMGRIIDGHKGRGNTMQSTALDRDMRQYVDFFVEYLTPLYDRSGDDHFFQYYNLNRKDNFEKYQRLTVNTLSGLRAARGKSAFFQKYSIKDISMSPSGEHNETRILWIDHNQIRKVKNLSEYLEGKQQWERQYLLGHNRSETEYIYQQAAHFQSMKKHRIAKSQDTFVKFLTGKISAKENPRLQVFNGLIADCRNPFNPTYPGAKKMHSNDVCTNWRKCLTECEQCEVIAPIHGPVIVAWRDCMDAMRSAYELTEAWEKEFLWDYMAAEATLSTFPKDILEECKIKAPKYTEFVRREVLNSQRARKMTEEERDAR